MDEADRDDRQIALEERLGAAGGRGPEADRRTPHFEEGRGRAGGIHVIGQLHCSVGGDADIMGMIADADDFAGFFHAGHDSGQGFVAGVVFLGQLDIAENVLIRRLQLLDARGRNRSTDLDILLHGKRRRSGL